MATTITTEFIPKAYVSIPFSFQLQVDGGVAPYTWSVDNPTNLPGGLTISYSGVISGTPTNTGFTEVPMPFRTKEVFLEIRSTDSGGVNQTVGRATIQLEIGRVVDEASLKDVILSNVDVDNMISVEIYLPILRGITNTSLQAIAAQKIEGVSVGADNIPKYLFLSF